MFCPNCGNDCGAAKFCVKCGTKIAQAEKETAWSVGMPCPNCGGTKLDGNNCAFCGTQLIICAPGKSKRQFPEPPVGRLYFCGSDGYLELTETHVVTYKKFMPLEKRGHIIPYDEIFAVSYTPGSSFVNLGVLCIRGWQDRYNPLSKTYSEAYDDASSVFFAKRYNDQFRVAYEFLRRCADINEAAREENKG